MKYYDVAKNMIIWKIPINYRDITCIILDVITFDKLGNDDESLYKRLNNAIQIFYCKYLKFTNYQF